MANITVVSFNVHFGKDTLSLAKLFGTHPTLKQADIFFLQEIEHHKTELVCRAESIAQSLGFYYAYAEARKIKRSATHGLAILSRFELAKQEIIKLPRHRISGSIQQRIAQTSSVKIDGKKITLCNIHLDTRIRPEKRAKQMDFAVQNLPTGDGAPTILGGDFNTIPWGNFIKPWSFFQRPQFAKVHEHLVSAGFNQYGPASGYTFKRGLFRMRLDHIYVRGELKMLEAKVLKDVRASDHLPVWAKIEMNKNDKNK